MAQSVSWKILARWLLAALLYYSCVLHLYRWLWGRHGSIILTYHRVLDPAEQQGFMQPGMYVKPQTFEKHLRYLTRYYQMVTMEQLMAWCEQSQSTRRPLCVITFDDGWGDNYHNALWLLRTYACPATLFIATSFIENGQTPWFYRLGDILHVLARVPNESYVTPYVADRECFPPVLVQWLGAVTTARRQHIDAVIEALKELPAVELERIIEQLQQLVQHAGQSIRGNEEAMLNWQQVQEMQAYGVEIGSHSLSHAILTRLPRATLAAEVIESKRLIETQLQQSVRGFCYPNGDCNDTVEALVRAAGYSYACTTRPGYVEPNDNPYRLKRIAVHDDITFSTALFACHIAGVFTWL